MHKLPTDDEFEKEFVSFCRDAVVFVDIGLADIGFDEMVQVLKFRFSVYWDFMSMKEEDEAISSNWRKYLDQCWDSPMFLDSDEVQYMDLALEVSEHENK